MYSRVLSADEVYQLAVSDNFLIVKEEPVEETPPVQTRWKDRRRKDKRIKVWFRHKRPHWQRRIW